ncbi:hypothetical protein B7494_g1509 [Chlorociboria aeruginascens]|nr:hypothetical protein B7494_g1509 [Chlorociboria aeruginascens]
MSQPNTSRAGTPEPANASASATAHASSTMVQDQSTPTSTASPTAPVADIAPARDVVMTDVTPDHPASPAVIQPMTNAPSPVPARIGTPIRNTNGNEITSRATSQHPDPTPAIPSEAPLHGAPTRQYLNSKVTGVLLEGMKQLAKEQPKDPLRVLGEFLLRRSKELEGN